MRYRLLPIVILGLTALLTAASIEFLPETVFFPVIEYSMGEDIHLAMHKTGELNRAACEQSAAPVAQVVRAQCPGCKLAERCERGLDAGHRQVLSRAPLSTPSASLPEGVLTITIAASDSGLALGVCRQIEAQSASQPINKRLTCYPSGTAR